MSEMLDEAPTPLTDDQKRLEAWRMLLNGAESHLEDAINEDGDWSDEDFEEVLKGAREILRQLRAKHKVPWRGTWPPSETTGVSTIKWLKDV